MHRMRRRRALRHLRSTTRPTKQIAGEALGVGVAVATSGVQSAKLLRAMGGYRSLHNPPVSSETAVTFIQLLLHHAISFAGSPLTLTPQTSPLHCRQHMAEQGAVGALVEMVASCDAVGQEAAAAALMMLASEEPNIRARIVAANGVRALVRALQVRTLVVRSLDRAGGGLWGTWLVRA